MNVAASDCHSTDGVDAVAQRGQFSRFAALLRRLTSFALAAGSLLAAGGCGDVPPDVPSGEDDSEFGVNPAGETILGDIERSRGALPVCLGMIGFEPSALFRETAKAKALITNAAVQWNALLRGNAQWTLTGRIAPVYRVQNTACPSGNARVITVNVYGNVAAFKAEHCSREGRVCAPTTYAARKTIVLGPWNRTHEVNALDPFTVLHEYGHLLGLGDTYRVPGRNDWIGEQPESIMNGKSSTLTNDDKLGLWVALRALKTGVRSCDGFGEDVVMTSNYWNFVMCNPRARPADTHDQPPPTP